MYVIMPGGRSFYATRPLRVLTNITTNRKNLSNWRQLCGKFSNFAPTRVASYLDEKNQQHSKRALAFFKEFKI